MSVSLQEKLRNSSESNFKLQMERTVVHFKAKSTSKPKKIMVCLLNPERLNLVMERLWLYYLQRLHLRLGLRLRPLPLLKIRPLAKPLRPPLPRLQLLEPNKSPHKPNLQMTWKNFNSLNRSKASKNNYKKQNKRSPPWNQPILSKNWLRWDKESENLRMKTECSKSKRKRQNFNHLNPHNKRQSNFRKRLTFSTVKKIFMKKTKLSWKRRSSDWRKNWILTRAILKNLKNWLSKWRTWKQKMQSCAKSCNQ